MPDPAPRAHHVTSLDRLGLAVLTGGGLGGVSAALLAMAGGTRAPVALAAAITLGAVTSMLGIVALGGPLWFVLHRLGRRGPGVAAAAAGLLALAAFTLAQTAGGSGGGYRPASALGTSVLIAVVAAAIGVAMHRVAYRRAM